MSKDALIYTSKGNLPVDSLTYAHRWEETADTVVFIEEYRLGEEIVKRNVHAYVKRGITSTAQGNL